MTRDQKLHCAATFVMDGTAAGGFFAFPFLLRHLGATVAETGMATSSRFAVYTLVCFGAGRIARRFRLGTRVAVLGAVIWAAGHAALPRCSSVLQVTVLGTAASAGLALFWPALQAWTGAVADSRQVLRRLVTFNTTWCIAVTLAPYPSGRLFEWDPGAPFIAAACGGLLAAALVLPLRPPPPMDGPAIIAPTRPVEALRAQPYLLLGWVTTSFAYVTQSVQRDILPRYAGDVIGMGPATLGALFVVRQACQTFMFWLPGRWLGWRFTARWVVGLQVLAALSFVLLARARSAGPIIVSYVVCGVYHGLAYFASMYYSVIDPGHRERRVGVHEAMVGIGNFVGPAAAGSVAGYFGSVPAGLMLVPVVGGVLVILEAAFLLRGGPRRPPLTGSRSSP